MNKIILSLSLIVILVIGGVIFYSSQQTSPSQKSKTQQPQTNTKNTDTQQPSARYLTYSAQTLNEATDKKRVLFFFASWCPTCIPADASFSEKANQIPTDTVVIRVNYNDPETDAEEKALAEKYGITYQHTFVQIDESGNQITKWNGGSIDELVTNIK